MSKYSFIKKVEDMIKPEDIATLQVVAPLANKLPLKTQNKMIKGTPDKTPYMGFVVEPYSFFLCYEIIDLEYAQSLLSDEFELIKTQIFTDDEPKYYCIFTNYNLHTSAFWGTRVEVNIIARSKISNLTSWVIVECDTNALYHDAASGIVGKTTDQALLTTDFAGNIIVDIVNHEKNRGLICDSSTVGATLKDLSYELWLEGNLSIGYGREISNNSSAVFGLKFDPREVEKGYSIDLDKVNIELNTWYPGLFKDTPEFAVYFPYAQHFISDSPGNDSKAYSEAEMVRQMNELDLDSIPDYSAEPIRKMFKKGLIINTIVVWSIITILLILLVIK